jgi:hypothetical protein
LIEAIEVKQTIDKLVPDKEKDEGEQKTPA